MLINMKVYKSVIFTIFIGLTLLFSVFAIQTTFSSTNSTKAITDSTNGVSKQQLQQLFTKYPQLNPNLNTKGSKTNVKIPFSGFMENKGQNGNQNIKYYYTSSQSGIAFTQSKILLSQAISLKTGINQNNPGNQQYYSFSLTFPGSNIVSPVGVNEMGDSTNYFTNGLNITGVNSYKEIWYYNLYPNIDLRYYISGTGLKYDFLVKSGGNPNNIVIKTSNNIKLSIKSNQVSYYTNNDLNKLLFIDNSLKVYYNDGTIINSKFVPISQTNNAYKVQLDKKDLTRLQNGNEKLVIDPFWLYFSTYLGGSGNDVGNGIAVDNAGNIYVTGYTTSSDFPFKNGYNSTYGNNQSGGSYVNLYVWK